MAIKKNYIDAYNSEDTARAKSTCLLLAQILGKHMKNDLVIVGGIVPSLLFQDAEPDPVMGSHAGSNDVDLVLSLVILDDKQYTNVRDSLKSGDFAPDTKEPSGNLVRQRWRHAPSGALVDFLMPLVPSNDQAGGALQDLESDFAATTMLGLDLALQHRRHITLVGKDLCDRSVTEEVPVCHPAVLVMLKALAMADRDAYKDAYDLFFVLKASSEGPDGLGKFLSGLRPHRALDDMEKSLDSKFKTIDSAGPANVCAFLRIDTMELRGEVLAYANSFLDAYRASRRAESAILPRQP
jgi:hypothetical protein